MGMIMELIVESERRDNLKEFLEWVSEASSLEDLADRIKQELERVEGKSSSGPTSAL